jgi:hypothetical protein
MENENRDCDEDDTRKGGLPFVWHDAETDKMNAYLVRIFFVWPAIAAVVICVIGVIVGSFIER